MLVDFSTDMAYVMFADSPKRYTFRIPKSLLDSGDLEVGDKVVVRTNNGQLSICTVSGLNATLPEQYKDSIAYIICRIDFTEELQRKERTEKRERLMNALEARKKKYEEKAIFDMIAEKDPEAKKLLEALNELGEV